MAKNFLPEYEPTIIDDMTRCLVRRIHINCPDDSEEVVRQRVLHWLLKEKGWPIQKIQVEHYHKVKGVGDKNKPIGRTDIEIIDEEETKLVIECKKEGRVLTNFVKQAKDYARKVKADYIWLTSGEKHLFLEREGKDWEFTDSLDILDVEYQGLPVFPVYPETLTGWSVEEYLHKLAESGGKDFRECSPYLVDIVMAIHKLFFGLEFKLPYSAAGIEIRESFEPLMKGIGNQGGGQWTGWYRGFNVRGPNKKENTLWVGTNFGYDEKYEYDDPDGLYLLVGNETTTELKHRLQLKLNWDNCDFYESKKYWEIYHDGKMSRIKSEEVMKAVSKSSLADLVDVYDGKEYVNLGKLHHPTNCTWRNSKDLIANLLSYSLIRQNFRESKSKKKK